jgi:hypothetical protein
MTAVSAALRVSGSKVHPLEPAQDLFDRFRGRCALGDLGGSPASDDRGEKGGAATRGVQHGRGGSPQELIRRPQDRFSQDRRRKVGPEKLAAVRADQQGVGARDSLLSLMPVERGEKIEGLTTTRHLAVRPRAPGRSSLRRYPPEGWRRVCVERI